MALSLSSGGSDGEACEAPAPPWEGHVGKQPHATPRLNTGSRGQQFFCRVKGLVPSSRAPHGFLRDETGQGMTCEGFCSSEGLRLELLRCCNEKGRLAFVTLGKVILRANAKVKCVLIMYKSYINVRVPLKTLPHL